MRQSDRVFLCSQCAANLDRHQLSQTAGPAKRSSEGAAAVRLTVHGCATPWWRRALPTTPDRDMGASLCDGHYPLGSIVPMCALEVSPLGFWPASNRTPSRVLSLSPGARTILCALIRDPGSPPTGLLPIVCIAIVLGFDSLPSLLLLQLPCPEALFATLLSSIAASARDCNSRFSGGSNSSSSLVLACSFIHRTY